MSIIVCFKDSMTIHKLDWIFQLCRTMEAQQRHLNISLRICKKARGERLLHIIIWQSDIYLIEVRMDVKSRRGHFDNDLARPRHVRPPILEANDCHLGQ
jgi:hypothetical protein